MTSQGTNDSSRFRGGFTLIELLIVIAIFGTLIGLLLPAVMMIRESARRTHCSNNIRQLGMALQTYDSSAGRFPIGAEFETGHSWITEILPYIEGQSIYDRFDFDLLWNDEFNLPASFTDLPIVQCPTSNIKAYPGYTDYCGISGSTLGHAGRLPINNGVFFIAEDEYTQSIRPTDIRDGMSHTIAISEAVAVTAINFGYWACGWHCFTQDDGGINNLHGGFNEIASMHPAGANVVFADGSIHFLSEYISIDVLSALCTRNGHEFVGEF